jgi:hypothetical protein
VLRTGRRVSIRRMRSHFQVALGAVPSFAGPLHAANSNAQGYFWGGVLVQQPANLCLSAAEAYQTTDMPSPLTWEKAFLLPPLLDTRDTTSSSCCCSVLVCAYTATPLLGGLLALGCSLQLCGSLGKC